MSALIGPAASKTLRVKEFRSSGTFTVPPGVKTVELFLVGGGGGSSDQFKLGSGGQILKTKYDVSAVSSCAVVIGAGGVNADGGDTSFDGVAVACGGIKDGTYDSGAALTGNVSSQSGQDGFGGAGLQMAGNGNGKFAPTNGSRAGKLTQPANSGAGANGGTTAAAGSGYCRVEWYE